METRSSPGRAPAAAQGGTARSATGALPNLIVIGAQKCGTSALHFYLNLHPEVGMSREKELNFFTRRNWRRGVDWYRAQFDPAAPVRGESSPNYTAYPLFKGVPKRMHSVVPDAKLIYIVRDPLERIGAHWVHNYSHGRVDGDLAELMRTSRRRYLARSRYHMQLQRFLRRYPLDRILILDQSDLRGDRPETLRRVFEFAGVDPSFTHPLFRRERHATGRKRRLTALGERLDRYRRRSERPLIPERIWAPARHHWPLGRPIDAPDVRAAVPDDAIEVLRRDAERLRELTGRDFGNWSIWEA